MLAGIDHGIIRERACALVQEEVAVRATPPCGHSRRCRPGMGSLAADRRQRASKYTAPQPGQAAAPMGVSAKLGACGRSPPHLEADAAGIGLARAVRDGEVVVGGGEEAEALGELA